MCMHNKITNIIENKNKYHTVRIVPESNIKIVGGGEIDTPK